MFSLVKLTTFVALAFGAIASVSAAPQPAAAVQVKRQSDAITAILADLTAELAPAAAQLSSSFPFACHISVADRCRKHPRLP